MVDIAVERSRLRGVMPRSAHADLVLPDDRDPLAIIEQQHETRLPDLIPVRIARMLESPFAFYRGTAGVMAFDLAKARVTGIDVVACGDAHISNFGFFASPERKLLFDLNDFDEAGVAPWEWDLKRLAASLHIASRHIGMSEADARDAVVGAVRTYRITLGRLVELPAMQRFYTHVDSDQVERLVGDAARRARKAASKARTRTSEQVLERLTTRETASGQLRIEDQPPIAVHVDHATFGELDKLFKLYRKSLREDIAYLLERFTLADWVLRVVGVGSVGTRCYLLAFEDPERNVLFLQAKEANASVLNQYGRRTGVIPGMNRGRYRSDGHRVVAGQRILQAHSDPFLGWITGFAGDREGRPKVDYYWRQFRDMKGSIDPSVLSATELPVYGALCAGLLARAQSQSPNAHLISAYLGRSERFDGAIADWSAAYADVAERDYESLRKGVLAGRFPVAE